MKGLVETVLMTTAGGIGGALAYRIIGGVGIAALGTAVGVNFVGFVIVGACVSSYSYGIYRLGTRKRKVG